MPMTAPPSELTTQERIERLPDVRGWSVKLHWKTRKGQRRLRLRVDSNGADRAAELNRTRWPFSVGPGGRIRVSVQFPRRRVQVSSGGPTERLRKSVVDRRGV